MITAEQFIREVNKNKEQTQALISSANETTKQNDTTLTDAVNHLKEGYGQGGGGDNYYDTFWDSYQNFGKRTNYGNAFAGNGWNTDTLKPKYPIVPTNAYMLFRTCTFAGDLTECLSLDLSHAENTQYMFTQARNITRIGVVDVRGSTETLPLDTTFQYCTSLVTIDKIFPKNGTRGAFNNATFHECTGLVNLTIEENSIASNGLNLQWSTKLSKASILSVINALSTTTSGLTVTFSKAAVDKAFETASGANNGSASEEWLALRATRSNWTISLG
jgi:hypothetical protein